MPGLIVLIQGSPIQKGPAASKAHSEKDSQPLLAPGTAPDLDPTPGADSSNAVVHSVDQTKVRGWILGSSLAAATALSSGHHVRSAVAASRLQWSNRLDPKSAAGGPSEALSHLSHQPATGLIEQPHTPTPHAFGASIEPYNAILWRSNVCCSAWHHRHSCRYSID